MTDCSPDTPEARDAVAAGSPLRVLLASPPGSGLHYSGPGMSAFRLYRAAAPGRFEVTLLHGYPPQDRYDVFADQHFVSPQGPGFLNQVRFIRGAGRWLAAHAEEFDVLHGLQGFETTLGPAESAMRSGLPSVIKLALAHMDLGSKGGWKRLLRLPERRRRRIRLLSGIIAISSVIVDELRAYGIPESKIVHIPNGVDTDRFAPAASEADRREQRAELGWRDLPTLLIAGGVNRRKRPSLLVEAAGLLHHDGIECQVVIAGPEEDPEYASAIRRTVRDRGIDALVVWAGFTPEMSPLYRAADLFCLPSRAEGMPNAVLEAMASGLPAIVTRISGTSDLTEDGVNGCFIEPDPAVLADRVRTYLEDPALRAAHGAAARERILTDFSARVVLDAHEALFRRIMAGADANPGSGSPSRPRNSRVA